MDYCLFCLINSSKEVSGNVRNAFFDLDFMAMQQGVKIENETISVWEDESLNVSDTGTVTLSYLPVLDAASTSIWSPSSLVNETLDNGRYERVTVPVSLTFRLSSSHTEIVSFSIYLDFMAMQQGVKIENETISVWEDESLNVSDTGTVTLSYLPLSKVL